MRMPKQPTTTGEATKRADEADAIRQDHRQIGADGIEAAMREIDDAAEREDQREAERDEQVIRADQQAVENLLEDENDIARGKLGTEGTEAIPGALK